MLEFGARSPKILVVGDLMIDHYIWGDSTRISPEAPVQVVDVRSENNRLGGACNVANNLVSLGASVEIFGVVGQDSRGEWLLGALEQLGIKTTQIHKDVLRPTTQKTRVILSHQQILRIDREEKAPIAERVRAEFLSTLQKNIGEYDAVILSDYDKGVLGREFTQSIISLARNAKKPVLCDPKGEDYSKYSGATLLTPNKKEAQGASGIKICDDESLERAAKKLQEECQLDISLITLSEDGIGILDSAKRIVKIPTIAREVFDVTGAGDTVIAALAFCLAQGIDIYQACKFANAAAAVVVGKVGSAVASLEEIAAFVGQESEKILTKESLLSRLSLLRAQGKRVIFTNGCFDILHKGHVKYLQEARALGDLLIVGLNTDSSIKRLKGEARPINPQEDRAFVLSGLGCVDFVVLFDEDTPHALIKSIAPDVLVKGADYAGKEVVGSEFVSEVVLIDFVEGKSTTAIIQKIKG